MIYNLYDLLGLLMLEFNVQEVEPWKFLGETSSKPCEHSLTKVNLWKIQKLRCESIFLHKCKVSFLWKCLIII